MEEMEETSSRNQAKLQQNLMYIAPIADSQPHQTASLSQVLKYPSNLMMQSGPLEHAAAVGAADVAAAQSQQQQAMSPLQQQQHEGSTSISADGRGANSSTHSGDGEYLIHGLLPLLQVAVVVVVPCGGGGCSSAVLVLPVLAAARRTSARRMSRDLAMASLSRRCLPA